MDKLNSFLQPGDSPANNEGKNVPWKQGVNQNIQQGRVRMSQANIKNFVQLSGFAVASGSLPSNVTANVTTQLTPQVPHQNDINFAVPYVALYEGTAISTTMQIYPYNGSGVTPSDWLVEGGAFDLENYTGSGTNTAWSWWSMKVTNKSASGKAITFVSQWRWIQYNNGAVTST